MILSHYFFEMGLERIKEFATEQVNEPRYDEVFVPSEEKGTDVNSPWVDAKKEYDLNDIAAVEEWGLYLIVKFSKKVVAKLKGISVRTNQEIGYQDIKKFAKIQTEEKHVISFKSGSDNRDIYDPWQRGELTDVQVVKKYGLEIIIWYILTVEEYLDEHIDVLSDIKLYN